MRTRDFHGPLIAVLLLIPATAAQAWGPTGHRVIGRAAFELLDAPARAEVMGILGIGTPAEAADALDAACNWPDEVRDTPEWAWSGPLHYVNLPRHSRHYERERDCPDGLCVTEGVLRYAAALANPAAGPERRWQALAFLCHLVGDLHQPLHAGFRDDRGGNYVEVAYRGEAWNLHEWWDGVLVRERIGDEDRRVTATATAARALPASPWNPEEVALWTEQSHDIACDAAYPPEAVIDTPFADRSWSIIERQWRLAAARLAGILNAQLGDTETEIAPAGDAHDGAAPPG
ncbi:MAG: S1/P1 nuclease [Xanthomonadales bacterium]